MTDIVPAETRGPADPRLVDRLALLDTAAAEYARPIRNTEEAYRADWRAWLRFLEELNSGLAEQDPHGTPVPPTVTNMGVFVAFMAWHERRKLAPTTAERRLYGVIMTCASTTTSRYRSRPSAPLGRPSPTTAASWPRPTPRAAEGMHRP